MISVFYFTRNHRRC